MRRMDARGTTLGMRPAEVPNERRAIGETGASRVQFAGFEFDFRRDELLRGGDPVPLRPKPLALLRYLLAHPGRLLGKDELMAALWPGAVVTDDSLVQCVGELRAALGDRAQTLVRTLPRRGYRLDAPVQPVAGAAVVLGAPGPALSDPAPAARPPSRRGRWLAAAVAGVALAILVGLALQAPSEGPAPMNIDQALAASRATAVLALADADAPGGISSFGNGIADAVVTHISLRSRPVSPVLGRASTAHFDAATPDIARMGRELDVRYVVGGRITRYNGKVQVVTQVTAVDKGRVLTLDQSEYPDEAAALASNLAQRIASAVRMRYIEFDETRFQEAGRQPDAAELARAGFRDINTFMTREDLLRARSRLEAAARADRRSVMVAQGLGLTHLLEFGAYMSPTPLRQLDLSEQYLRQAIDLAPQIQENLAAWADVLSWRGQVQEAERVLRQLLDANPNYATSRLGLANALIRQDRVDEALAHIERARRLSPADSRLQRMIYSKQLDAALTRGDDAQAREIAANWCADYPGNGLPWAVLAVLDSRAGRREEAAASLARARALLPEFTLDYLRLTRQGGGPAYRAATERLVAGLREAGWRER